MLRSDARGTPFQIKAHMTQPQRPAAIPPSKSKVASPSLEELLIRSGVERRLATLLSDWADAKFLKKGARKKAVQKLAQTTPRRRFHGVSPRCAMPGVHRKTSRCRAGAPRQGARPSEGLGSSRRQLRDGKPLDAAREAGSWLHVPHTYSAPPLPSNDRRERLRARGGSVTSSTPLRRRRRRRRERPHPSFRLQMVLSQSQPRRPLRGGKRDGPHLGRTAASPPISRR